MIEQSLLAPTAAPPAADGLIVDPGTDLHGFEALARDFVDAFNERDADALIALADPRIVFRPSTLVGPRKTYIGHEGLRRWVAELAAIGLDFQVQIREIRSLSPSGFIVLSKLRVGDELITDCAMIAVLHERRIIDAHGYLSDEQMLIRVGAIPSPDW